MCPKICLWVPASRQSGHKVRTISSKALLADAWLSMSRKTRNKKHKETSPYITTCRASRRRGELNGDDKKPSLCHLRRGRTTCQWYGSSYPDTSPNYPWFWTFQLIAHAHTQSHRHTHTHKMENDAAKVMKPSTKPKPHTLHGHKEQISNFQDFHRILSLEPNHDFITS